MRPEPGWMATVALLAVACGRTPAAVRSGAPDVLTPYLVGSDALGPVSTELDSLMAVAAADEGRQWDGLNPSRPIASGHLGVVVVDAARLRKDGCRRQLSTACRWGTLTRNTCAVIDRTTIGCDGAFLLTLLSIAGHAGDEALLPREEEKHGRKARFEEFFAREHARDLLARGARVTTKCNADQVYGDRVRVWLRGALGLVLFHELGHIVKGHLAEGTLGVVLPPRTLDWEGSGPEVEADDYAMATLVRNADPTVV